MAALKILVFLTLLGVCAAEAQPCKDCQAEELSLVQGRLTAADDSQRFPNLGKLKDVFGDIADAAGDAKETLLKAITTGMSTATKTVETTLKTVDGKVEELSANCNKSFDKFRAAADFNASLEENITRFQELLNSTVGKAVPIYTTIGEKVNDTLSTVTALLEQIGQGNLAKTMNASMSSAMTKMGSLRDSTATALASAGEIATAEAAEKLAKVNSALETGAQSARGFANGFQSSLKEAVEGLKKAIKEKLPKDQQERIGKPLDSMLEMASATCKKLAEAVANVASQVEESSKTVMESAKALAAKKGAWDHIKDFFSSLR